MTRVLIVVALLALAPHAQADPYWRSSGSRGTVTAYELDGRTVIDRRLCTTHVRTGTVEYSYCSARLREEVKARLCQRRGWGTHHYYFQTGDGRPYRSSVYCTRRY